MTNRCCSICAKPMESEAVACQPCQNRLDSTLAEIVTLHAELPDHLERGQSNGQRVSGSREAPLPLRVDPLDLSLEARTFNPTPEAKAHPEDWDGHASVLSLLDLWVRDWRDIRGKGENLPVPAGPSMVSWLRNRLDWACKEHPAIDEFDAEMRELRAALRSACEANEAQVAYLDVPCRRCDWLSLIRAPGEDVECGHCGDLSTLDEHERWAGLVVAGIQHGAVPVPPDTLFGTVDAAKFVDVRPDTIRQWASRDILPVADRTRRGRPLYRAGDLRAIKDAKQGAS